MEEEDVGFKSSLSRLPEYIYREGNKAELFFKVVDGQWTGGYLFDKDLGFKNNIFYKRDKLERVIDELFNYFYG